MSGKHVGYQTMVAISSERAEQGRVRNLPSDLREQIVYLAARFYISGGRHTRLLKSNAASVGIDNVTAMREYMRWESQA